MCAAFFTVVSGLLTAGSVQAADMRPLAPPPVAESAPAPSEQSSVSPFPCLFDCAEQQAAAPAESAVPSSDPEPVPTAVRHKRTQHAFAQARSPKNEGRSISVAPKVSRPVLPKQPVVLSRPASMPLDAGAMPADWQMRAAPPKVVPAATPTPRDPWGTLNRP